MSNHFAYVSPNILDQLRHLKIPDSFDTSKLKFVAGGGYSDVFKAEHHFPGRPTSCIIAIKQLRFYMKEDIIMVCIKQVYEPFRAFSVLIVISLYILSYTNCTCPSYLKKKYQYGQTFNIRTSLLYLDLLSKSGLGIPY